MLSQLRDTTFSEGRGAKTKAPGIYPDTRFLLFRKSMDPGGNLEKVIGGVGNRLGRGELREPRHLRVGGDDTLIAGDEVDLTEATAREQRRRGEIGTSRAPLGTESTKTANRVGTNVSIRTRQGEW